MPSRLANVTGRHRLTLREFDGTDDWVEIRAGRSSRAAARINSAGVEIGGLTADGRPLLSAKFDLNEMRSVLFEESIVAWSFRGDDGASGPLPVERYTFEALDGPLGAWLDAEITRYYSQRRLPDDAAKNSNGNSLAPSEPASQFPTPSETSN